MLTTLITAAAEHATEEPAVEPWVVGASAFGILAILMLVLLAFGKGREHT